MDIVDWVYNLQRELEEAGQHRLAALIDAIPDHVHENRASAAEALLPEAIAGARSLKNPWLEIYFRHWEMRNRLGNMAEGEAALADVVSLLEFSHRPENLPCPQSVCTTHDISGCYANLDGPGWAEERKEVCEETLARVTPKWPCYTCLNREYVDALLDQNRYAEAEARLDALEAALREHGQDADSRLYRDRAAVRHALGDHAGALALIEKAESFDDFITQSEGNRKRTDIQKSKVLAAMNRIDDARELLPPWADLTPGDYAAWASTACAIALKEPSANTWGLGNCLTIASAHLCKVGAHRDAVLLALKQVETACLRGARITAENALAVAEEYLPKLRAPHGADEAVQAAREQLRAMPEEIALPAAFSGPEDLLERLGAPQNDPEQDAAVLRAALRAHPDRGDIAEALAGAYSALRLPEKAAQSLRAFLRRAGTVDEDIFFRLLGLYLDAGNDGEVEVLCRDTAGQAPGLAAWGRAYAATVRERWEAAEPDAEEACRLLPERPAPSRFHALAALKQNKFAEAAFRSERTAKLAEAAGEDPTADRWRVLLAASAAENWATVRRLATEMNMEPEDKNVDPAAPLEEDWGWIRLRYLEDGVTREYFAVRTGPCTARVVSVASPEDPQHVKDLVVFSPFLIEEEPEDPEEAEDYVTPYQAVHTLQSAGYKAWLFDGPDPGEKAFDAFCAVLEAKNCAVRLRQREGYTVQNPDDPENEEARLPGIYFAAASPPEMTAAELCRLADSLTAGWPRPVCYYYLAKSAGQDAAEHERVIEEYGL